MLMTCPEQDTKRLVGLQVDTRVVHTFEPLGALIGGDAGTSAIFQYGMRIDDSYFSIDFLLTRLSCKIRAVYVPHC